MQCAQELKSCYTASTFRAHIWNRIIMICSTQDFRLIMSSAIHIYVKQEISDECHQVRGPSYKIYHEEEICFSVGRC